MKKNWIWGGGEGGRGGVHEKQRHGKNMGMGWSGVGSSENHTNETSQYIPKDVGFNGEDRKILYLHVHSLRGRPLRLIHPIFFCVFVLVMPKKCKDEIAL